ncbi:hypothetical protein HRG_011650 [Hirsutella rhossiliensis]|uniref:Uncharacterized protein n=1 Tax=Hirsutella rhossiliensis TaxID=111463 RepID=A0A9P8MLK9_9HYPO|nr:uncharacterized protein HRG_11650 [Hirsutella rhossiliensis]KAH0957503.1 hypothetical protein HRG_11650 [Hirsutella rhossiliensis]
METMLVESLAPRGDSAACPRGKAFYSCVGNRFSGCCTTDPCDLSGCPDDEAREGGAGDRDNSNDKSGDGSRRRPPTDENLTASSTKTDSGITHTIPNHSVVTVTRHTVVFSEAPSSTTSSTTTLSSQEATPLTSDHAPATTAVAPAPSATSSTRVETSAAGSTKDGEAAGFSSGAIVGTVAGGIVLGVVLVVLVVACRRRNRNRAASEADSAAAFPDGLGGSNDAEKPHGQQQYQPPMSAHTTGSSDPFAPFGGRADVPPDPYRPPSGTFEMDGAGMAPVELPAEPATPSHALGPRQPRQTYRAYGPAGDPATDPRANLNSLKTDSGHAAYINHWDQWKALGGGGDKS